MAQNSNNSDFGWKYQSRVKTLRWPIFLVRKPWDGPKFEEKSYSRQRWFEMWTKNGPSQGIDPWLIFRAEIWIVRILGHLKVRCIYLHVTWHTSNAFWTISRTLRMMCITLCKFNFIWYLTLVSHRQKKWTNVYYCNWKFTSDQIDTPNWWLIRLYWKYVIKRGTISFR